MTQATHNTSDEVVGWRMKDRYRFRNPDLVAICYTTQCREVFDLHEAICDLIDEERSNRISVSMLTLATMIHDYPQGDEWTAKRIAVLEQLRQRGLVEFDGEVTLTGELEISLPQRVYQRWHEAGRKQRANTRERDPNTGMFLRKNPAPTTNTPMDPHGTPEGSPMDPSKTKPKTKGIPRAGSAGEREPAPEDPTRSPLDPTTQQQMQFKQTAATTLATVLDGDTTLIAEQLLWKAQAVHPKAKRRYPLSQWQLAVEALAERIRDGFQPSGDVIGYIIGIVPTASTATVAVKPGAQRSRARITNPDTTGSDWDYLSATSSVGGAA